MMRHFSASARTMQRFKRVQALLDQLYPEAVPRALTVPGSPQPHNGIIVFAGSFNPLTNAHLALMKQAQRCVPSHHLYAAISKHTIDKERVEQPMLLDRIILLDKVLHRRLPHAGIMLFNRGLYVEQAQAIRSSFPKVKRICFLLGFDKVVQILDPRYYEDRDAALSALFALAELLVAPRGRSSESDLAALLHLPQNQRFAQYIHALPFSALYRDVSSTSVRQGGTQYFHDIPQEVRQFMAETRAYAPPLRLKDGSEVDSYGERMKELEAALRR